MADFKNNYFQKKNKFKGPRSNHSITSQEVQLITSDVENLVILNIRYKYIKKLKIAIGICFEY